MDDDEFLNCSVLLLFLMVLFESVKVNDALDCFCFLMSGIIGDGDSDDDVDDDEDKEMPALLLSLLLIKSSMLLITSFCLVGFLTNGVVSLLSLIHI